MKKFLVIIESEEIENVVFLIGEEKEEVKRRFIDTMYYKYDWDDVNIYDIEELEHNWSYWHGNR